MSNNQEKNTLIILEGRERDFDKILTLFHSGELEKILDVSILDIDTFNKKRGTESTLISNLSGWFKKNFLTGWEYETTLLGTLFAQENNSNFSFSSTRSANDVASNSTTERNLETNSENLSNSFKLALELGEDNNSSPEVITQLVNSIQTCNNEEILWQLALSLGKLAPEHPQAAIARRKEFQLGNLMLELIVGVKKRQDEKLDILLQLYSTEEDYLPSQLTVTVSNETGDINAQFKTQDENFDSYINLSFVRSLDEQFTIEISLENNRFQEHFRV